MMFITHKYFKLWIMGGGLIILAAAWIGGNLFAGILFVSMASLAVLYCSWMRIRQGGKGCTAHKIDSRTTLPGQSVEQAAGLSCETLRDSLMELASRFSYLQKMRKRVDELGSQCQLLCVNATMEAACVGESARHTAVVAAQIHKVAVGVSEQLKRVDEVFTLSTSNIDQSIELLTDNIECQPALDGRVSWLLNSARSWNETMEEQMDYIAHICSELIFQLKTLTESLRLQKAVERLSGQIYKSIEKLYRILEQTEEGCEVLIRIFQSRELPVKNARASWHAQLEKLEKNKQSGSTTHLH